MDQLSHSQPAPALAHGAARPQGRPRGSKNRPRTQLEGSHADTQASQCVSASQPPPTSQARNSSLAMNWALVDVLWFNICSLFVVEYSSRPKHKLIQ
ncbi:hypothetical protein DSO57_1009717, partial [Entomophthora muscae]